MAKRNDYITGREDGLLMALEIVKNEGVEAHEKEIEFRNITRIRTAFGKKDIHGATIKIKEQTVDTVKILSVATVHDEFGFGTQRCDRFIKVPQHRFARVVGKAHMVEHDIAALIGQLLAAGLQGSVQNLVHPGSPPPYSRPPAPRSPRRANRSGRPRGNRGRCRRPYPRP